MTNTLRSFVALLLGFVTACATAGGKGDTFEARKRLTRELIARQDWPTAFAYADEMHRERSGDAEVLALRGTIYREQGLPAEAETDLKQALALRPDLAEAHAALGIIYDSTRRGELAETHHRRATALVPVSPSYLNNLGFSLLLRKKNREAIEILHQAARLAPTNRRIRTNLGFAYAASGDLPRASKEFLLSGNRSEALNNLGFAYEQRGDLNNAYNSYVEAVRLDPKSSRARNNLIHVAQKLGKPVGDEIPPQAEPAIEGNSK